MTMSASNKMLRGVVQMTLRHPFWSIYTLGLRRVETDQCPVMATDGRSLYYNPEGVDKLSSNEILAVIAHEAAHIFLGHHYRIKGRDHRRFNLAADFAINPILKACGFEIPEWAAFPPKAWEGLSAEEMYPLITPEMQKQYNAASDIWELTNEDGSPLTPDQIRELEQEGKIKMKQASTAARMAGALSEGLQRLVGELTEPKQDWTDYIAVLASSTVKEDYRWYPSSRYTPANMLLPSTGSESRGQVVIALDMSGSVSDADARVMLSEVLGQIRTCQKGASCVQLAVVCFDSKICSITVINTEEDLVDPKGGGGTDFAPVMNWLPDSSEDLEGWTPKSCIVMTDGYCDSFGEDPGIPVVWALTEPNRNFVPPFGEVAPFYLSRDQD